MPSFDIVSRTDLADVGNAVRGATREIGTRYDFKGVDASFSLNEEDITLKAEVDFQLEQMMDRRGVFHPLRSIAKLESELRLRSKAMPLPLDSRYHQ